MKIICHLLAVYPAWFLLVFGSFVPFIWFCLYLFFLGFVFLGFLSLIWVFVCVCDGFGLFVSVIFLVLVLYS